MREAIARRGRAGILRWPVIAVSAALALAACSSSSSSRSSAAGGTSSASSASTAANASAAASGGGTDLKAKSISFWLSASTAQAAGYYTLAKDFKTKYGVTVNIVNVPYDGFQTKLRQAAQANALPDSGDVPGLDPIWTGKLQDLSGLASDSTYHFVQSILVKTSDGKVLSIPSDITAAGLYINKSLFDKAGISYPTDPSSTWTWDQFLAAIDKVRKATSAKYDLVYDASPARIRAWIYEHGGTGFQLGSDNKYHADPKTADLLQQFAALNNDVVMPKSVWTSGQDPNALFKSGQVVAYFSGVWQVSDFAESITNFQWAAVPTPAQPTQATDLNTGGNMVAFDNGNSDKAAAAKKWLEFIFDPTNYTQLAQTNGYLPVETGLTLNYPFKQQTALDAFALYNKEIAIADPISGSGNAAQTTLVLQGKAIQQDPTKDEMAKLINGQQNAQQTVTNIVNGLNSQLG